MTVANLEQFTLKNMSVTYTRAFVEFYNQRNNRQIYEIYKMIELEKICSLTTENPCNFDTHRIIEICLVHYSAYVVLKDQNKFVFYINNYIN